MISNNFLNEVSISYYRLAFVDIPCVYFIFRQGEKTKRKVSERSLFATEKSTIFIFQDKSVFFSGIINQLSSTLCSVFMHHSGSIVMTMTWTDEIRLIDGKANCVRRMRAVYRGRSAEDRTGLPLL
jgi:hypothetical protein